MTDHNPHRIAISAAIGAAEAERDGLNGSSRHPFDRLLRHLHAVLAAGDRAEFEPDVEVMTQADLDERRDARWALAELRLGLARALGRRTRQGGLAAAFGSGTERVSTPDDDVMIDDVRVHREGAATLRKRLATLVGLGSGSTNDGRLIARVERYVNLRREVADALGYPEDDAPSNDALVASIATTQATARRMRAERDRLHRALALFAGHTSGETDVEPSVLLREAAYATTNLDSRCSAALLELSTPVDTDTPED